MHILIIEDEKRLAVTIADVIGSAGYKTDICQNGAKGLDLVSQNCYDAVLLDVMLPGLNGYEVLCRMREAGNTTPVLMLTARSETSSKVRGLDSGADYYLTKPFENEELLACLRAIMRRKGVNAPDTLSYGDITLTPAASLLGCSDKTVSLSAKELDLMRLLIQNKNQYLSKETLLLRVWGYDSNAGFNSVEVYISFLRKKLSLLSSTVQILMVRNIGYKLEETA